ncbi:ATP-dependent DNA ligase [Streptomyces longwoodensis]|uniref:ATP-dependent DNA ligase n=1 Tax=Streptomyces longwoodensis TaxID=68231 RepID=UPI0036FFE27B
MAAAAEHPAYHIVFDVLEAAGVELLDRPYWERRALLEDLFAREVLAGPFILCPATTDQATMLDWLDPAWGATGIEGVVLKGSEQKYLPGKRAWLKVRSRVTAKALVGGGTGRLAAPASLLLARYDDSGRLRLIARTAPLAAAVRRDLAGRLRPAGPDHPWRGRRFSAGWATGGDLQYQPVAPDLVAEFLADTAVDEGIYRQPVRFVWLRDDLDATDVPVSPRGSRRQHPISRPCNSPRV